MNTVVIGLERLLQEEGLQKQYKGQRVGLLSNQASTDCSFRYSKDLFKTLFGEQLTCLFSPQHGFFSEKQDNMIESDHATDDLTGLPVFSLYGETRKPTREMFEHLDILFIDLVDVGTRVYTFMYTMAYCLEAAAAFNKKVVVLDRPNPIGGTQVEGNVLDPEFSSFVGLYPIPMRHGMTFGELAKYMNGEFEIGAQLEIVEMKGWLPELYFDDTDLSWVFPSPNMPTVDSAVVYSGQVIWEGTNISEGRGTTRPFELFGAPFIEHDVILGYLAKTELPGCYLRPLVFEPTSGKWAGETCRGFQLHVQDREAFLPYRTSLALYQAIAVCYPDKFSYKEPPYEYEYEKLPMDMILGDEKLRKRLECGESILKLESEWQEKLESFIKIRKQYLIYQ